jgi:hypothetical protein
MSTDDSHDEAHHDSPSTTVMNHDSPRTTIPKHDASLTDVSHHDKSSRTSSNDEGRDKPDCDNDNGGDNDVNSDVDNDHDKDMSITTPAVLPKKILMPQNPVAGELTGLKLHECPPTHNGFLYQVRYPLKNEMVRVSFQNEGDNAWVLVKIVDILTRWNKNGEFWSNIKIISPANRKTKSRADLSFLFWPGNTNWTVLEKNDHIPKSSSSMSDIEKNPGPNYGSIEVSDVEMVDWNMTDISNMTDQPQNVSNVTEPPENVRISEHQFLGQDDPQLAGNDSVEV